MSLDVSNLSCACRWLIAIAFWLSGGFIKSGLGNRVAYVIVAAFGKTTLGLAYSLVFAEALLAPAIPSVAARAGGIFFPLVKALCLACGSDPVCSSPHLHHIFSSRMPVSLGWFILCECVHCSWQALISHIVLLLPQA